MKNRKIKILISACCVLLLAVITAGIYLNIFGTNINVSKKLNEAVGKAVIDNCKGNYLEGECSGEGHIILGTKKNGNETVVYCQIRYDEFGFINNCFVEVSGCVMPAVMTFENKDNEYVFKSVQYPQDGEGYGDSIKKLFPWQYHARILNSYNKKTDDRLWKQSCAYAKAYLKKIGREAEVKDYADLNIVILSHSGVSEKIVNDALDNCVYDIKSRHFSGELGTVEELKSGIRYIKRTAASKENDSIIFVKENEKGTKALSCFLFSKNGNRSSEDIGELLKSDFIVEEVRADGTAILKFINSNDKISIKIADEDEYTFNNLSVADEITVLYKAEKDGEIQGAFDVWNSKLYYAENLCS